MDHLYISDKKNVILIVIIYIYIYIYIYIPVCSISILLCASIRVYSLGL